MDLIHPRTRIAFREACSDFGVLRGITDAFKSEGLDSANDDPELDQGGGMRRSLFDQYTKLVRWDESTDVRKVLNAFETILSWTASEVTPQMKQSRENLVRLLARDGFSVDEMGRISGGQLTTPGDLNHGLLSDSAAIIEHLERLNRASDAKPGEIISAAKALLESTCKIALRELGQAFDERKDDIPTLVRRVQTGLLEQDLALTPTNSGDQTVKRLLSNLSQVAIGVAELRNEYGIDHGRSYVIANLESRHAALALGSASTFCRFVIEATAATKAGLNDHAHSNPQA